MYLPARMLALNRIQLRGRDQESAGMSEVRLVSQSIPCLSPGLRLMLFWSDYLLVLLSMVGLNNIMAKEQGE